MIKVIVLAIVLGFIWVAWQPSFPEEEQLKIVKGRVESLVKNIDDGAEDQYVYISVARRGKSEVAVTFDDSVLRGLEKGDSVKFGIWETESDFPLLWTARISRKTVLKYKTTLERKHEQWVFNKYITMGVLAFIGLGMLFPSRE